MASTRIDSSTKYQNQLNTGGSTLRTKSTNLLSEQESAGRFSQNHQESLSPSKQRSPVKNSNTSTSVVSASKDYSMKGASGAKSSQDQQNELATRFYHSSSSNDDDCLQTGSENRGDSDFEPPEKAVLHPSHSLSYYDSIHTGQKQGVRVDHYGYSSSHAQGKYETDFFTDSAHENSYTDDISYKLAAEEHALHQHSSHHASERRPDNADNIYTLRRQFKPARVREDSSEPEQKHYQQMDSDLDEEMMDDDMENGALSVPAKTVHHQHSTNVRRFARNTGTYQASFAKPARQHRMDEESDEAEYYSQQHQDQKRSQMISSDGEELQDMGERQYAAEREGHHSPQYKYGYPSGAPSRVQLWSEREPISDKMQDRIQKQAQIQALHSQKKWVQEQEHDDDDRFKSTGVGFSPQQQLYHSYSSKSPTEDQQPRQSFGYKQDVARFETGEQIREQHSYAESSQYKYAMMYPQKQITKEMWEQQNRNMGQPLPPEQKSQTGASKKKKKQASSEAHFLLTGYLQHHMENRSFFKIKGKDESPAVENNREGLYKWFASLSVQDRVNCLTTTFQVFTNSIVEMLSRYVRHNGPLQIFSLKRDKSQEGQGESTTLRKRGQQLDSGECILEKVTGSDESQRIHQVYYCDHTSVRKFQTQIIKFTRIMTNKNQFDTLTVSSELVKDPNDFFGLIENITDGKAFSQPVAFVQKNGVKPLIQSPKWIDCKKQNYLGVWIVAILEESLWAHFNVAKGYNIPSNCNKNELNKLFEQRTEKLQDPEDLAKRWSELGQEGQQKLLEQLAAYAKEHPVQEFQRMYEDQERRTPSYQHSSYNEDIYQYNRNNLYNFSHGNEPMRQDILEEFYRAQGDQQGGIPVRSGQIVMFANKNQDTDLKDIVDVLGYCSDPMEIIRCLSEIPLQEVNHRNHIRKHHLKTELHKMIQADLRQAIQEKLINECLGLDSSNEKKGDGVLAAQKTQKKKKQKEKEEQKKLKKSQKQQQYKKKSVSRSPPKKSEKVLEKMPSGKLEPAPTQATPQVASPAKETAKEPVVEASKQPSRVPSTATSDDQQQQPQKPQRQNTKKKQDKKKAEKQQESQEQVLKSVKTLLHDIVESVCQLEQERQLKLQQEEVHSASDHSSEDKNIDEKEPSPCKLQEALPTTDQSKPQAQTDAQQSQRRRRKPKKKPNNIEEQLNNYVRSVCGNPHSTERPPDSKKQSQQGKDPKKQAQQKQAPKPQPQVQKFQPAQQQQPQQPMRSRKEKPAEQSNLDEPQPIPISKHSPLGTPLPEPVGEPASPTRIALRMQQLHQTSTQELLTITSSVAADVNVPEKNEAPSIKTPQAEVVQINLSEHFGQQFSQEAFQVKETKDTGFTWTQPTINPNAMSTTSNAFMPEQPEPQSIYKYNSSQNYYPQQVQQQPHFEPLQKHYSQQQPQYARQPGPFSPKHPNKMYPRPYQPQYQKAGASYGDSSSSGGSFQPRTPKGGFPQPPQQQMQQPKSDFFQFQEQKSQIRLDAPAFMPGLDAPNQDVSEPDFKKPPQNQMAFGAQPFQQLYYQEQIPMNQHPVFFRLEEQFYKKFDQDIEEKTIIIQSVIDRFEEERTYVIGKLQQMADKAFPNRGAVIKVFGSLMTGLALETSDMDIAVTGMRIDSRDDMVDDLHSLGDQVQKWSLIHDFKKHEKASIPVIKAILNMSEVAQEMGRPVTPEYDKVTLPIDISFDDSPPDSLNLHLSSQNYSMPSHHDYNSFGNPQMQRMASQDPNQQLLSLITGELGWNLQSQNDQFSDFSGPPPPKTHLGLASCQLLKEYVASYPHLKKVAVLLKHFLSVNSLNNAYLGGISSYSAVLLIVAYMNNFQLYKSPSLTPSRLLMGFLDFYSNCFDPSFYGVNTVNKMSFYRLPQVNQQQFVIQDPVNPANNTARNSFRTSEILAHFRAAFFSLKSRITNQFQQHMAQQEKLREQEFARAQVLSQQMWGGGSITPEGGEPPRDPVSQHSPGALLAQAFDSINFCDCFLSNDILAEGADKQVNVVEALSYFQR